MDLFEDTRKWVGTNVLTAITALVLLYTVLGAIYRLYLSPLAKFPGRKLAALTLWYEFYHDFFRRGKYTWEIADMHAKYGPIVRISPYELHINDPDYYDHLYGHTLKLDKYWWIAREFGVSGSMQGTVPHDLHRLRRSALSPFFSVAKVVQLEDVITTKIEKLCRLMRQHQASKTSINMYSAYRAMAIDIISDYAMARSFDYLDREDLGRPWIDMINHATEAAYLTCQYGWLLPLMKGLPFKLAKWLVPDTAAALGIHNQNKDQVTAIKTAGPNVLYDEKKHPTIFYELLFKSHLPSHELEIDRVAQEGTLVTVAGSETIGNSLTLLHFHLLNNPAKLARLREELSQAMPDPNRIPTWQELKKLPYLTACIEENLRITAGIPHRLARMAPKQGLTFHEWDIPAGTPVSMSIYLIHRMNPTIFPQPDEFIPERWLSPDAKSLKKYLVPFGKGPRACLGIDLAYAELYLVTAMVQRRFDTQLFETTLHDVDMVHDFFVAAASSDSKGVRVVVK